VSHDLYGKLIRPDAPEKTKVLVSRLAVVSFSVIPVLIALRKLDLVNFVVIYAAKLMVSFVFVPVIVGLNWRRATRAGALASMLGGGIACLTWSVVGDPYFLGLDAAEAGILAGAILIVVVSLITRPVAPEHLRVFFQDSTASHPTT
jgi:Na+(H+)/acetate symporter ActP